MSWILGKTKQEKTKQAFHCTVTLADLKIFCHHIRA